ncbi:GDP-L-fucose synthase family protein [Sediminispirochaeta smaragdinae]|uniref:GDP-L-fucose synthase n=1 Tax=Sediminispirochaeta smaragdinae (strain DSM 11293 / JCM 15392 / SEBR 4228) TaxID=573413 RepID=E1RA23_SEDSS|nr:GDP-L-fucose synthase [Sediminispirochaeta smaragdinae]ADK83342.1 NAD-dependent epimerase/dehydratase [Sediminispirochaeta smaragdinae DSM 11293]
MNKNSKIYLAGHRGLVGSAIYRVLQKSGYTNIVTRTHKELDLTRQAETEAFFAEEKPEYVILAAAKVGGIGANPAYPAEFIYENSEIALNVIHSSYKFGVKKLLNLGSSCIYPKMAPQPLKEEYLLTGPLEVTNEAYAVAKIAAIRICKHYNQQYGTNFISAMPTNLYGPGDNYDLETSHVLPALIRKFHEAKMNGGPVILWGDGSPKREFLYSEDLAEASLFLLEHIDAEKAGEIVNVGTGEDLSIKELAKLISTIVGYKGEIRWDTTKPNGTPRKLLDVSRIHKLGWQAKTSLEKGIRKTYQHYVEPNKESA